MRTYRRLLILACLALAPTPLLPAQDLKAFLDGDRIYASAPHLHFLAGRPIERLQNGAAVPFTLQLTAATGGKIVAQSSGRVILSFDLWEERFSVVQDSPRRVASHLSSDAAEARSVDSVSIPVSALAGQKSFVLKLEIRAEDDPASSEAEAANAGLSMAGLIEVFSRRAKEQPSRWSAWSGPLRVQDLTQKSPSGRERNGASLPLKSRGH